MMIGKSGLSDVYKTIVNFLNTLFENIGNSLEPYLNAVEGVMTQVSP